MGPSGAFMAHHSSSTDGSSGSSDLRSVPSDTIAGPALDPLGDVDVLVPIVERARGRGTATLGHVMGLIAAGRLVAVAGPGGFSLVADATNAKAIARLRTAKRRPDEPLAVVVVDVAAAKSLGECSLEAVEALQSPSRPVVLVPARQQRVTDLVAPGLREVGVVLPSSPTLEVIVRRLGRPLAITSAARTGLPPAVTVAELIERADVARVDAVVDVGRRPVESEDAPVSMLRAGASTMAVVRLGRGLAPRQLPSPAVADASRVVAAVGAGQPGSVTVGRGGQAHLGPRLGDMDQSVVQEQHRRQLGRALAGRDWFPDVIAHDLNPALASTRLAVSLQVPTLAVQHQHAHLAAVLGEHDVAGEVVGVVFDRSGLGHDGTEWGGEFLLGGVRHVQRVGHLLTVDAPGGARHARDGWRVAAAWLVASEGVAAAQRWVDGLGLDEQSEVMSRTVAPMAAQTSSMGRLFDAVAALAGMRLSWTWDGQCVAELSQAFGDTAARAPRRLEDLVVWDPEQSVIDPRGFFRWLLRRRPRPDDIAVFLHGALAHAVVDAAADLAARHGVGTVALAGDVWESRPLRTQVQADLKKLGLRVLAASMVPSDDAAISYGQAVVASAAEAAPMSVTSADH